MYVPTSHSEILVAVEIVISVEQISPQKRNFLWQNVDFDTNFNFCEKYRVHLGKGNLTEHIH